MTCGRTDHTRFASAPAEPCDHDWEHVDESFSHEFGTEQVYFKRCRLCDATVDDDGDEE